MVGIGARLIDFLCASWAMGRRRRRTTGFAGRPREAGFSLPELLVVMVILVLLASIAGPYVIGYIGSSKSKTAKIQIEGFVTSLELYRIDTGRYPSSAEGLEALIKKPPSAQVWNGPYLKKAQVPLDPWGRAYHYKSPGEHGAFDIYTFGADNQQGGTGEDADVTSWQ